MLVRAVLDLCFCPILLLVALFARLAPAAVEVGIGPTPIINSPGHKLALAHVGRGAEVFVDSIWDYDIPCDYCPNFLLKGPLRAFVPYLLAARTFLRYRTLYTYFDGGPLRATAWLYLFEPLLLKIAGVKSVIMAFGADVHLLARMSDPYCVHAYGIDYDGHRFLQRRIERKVNLWTSRADHIVGGCDWVRYMPFWHTLTISHFVIDLETVKPSAQKKISGAGQPLKILHAPNHRTLKGTDFILRAVEELAAEGRRIELRVLERMPHDRILQAIEDADIVVDQLVIGWYAMFSIEAMALETPCVCYLDPSLMRLYTRVGLLDEGECPLISATPETFKDLLRRLDEDRSLLEAASAKSRRYVERHHSPKAVGAVFDRIQKELIG